MEKRWKKNEVKTAVNEALSSLRLSEYGEIVFLGALEFNHLDVIFEWDDAITLTCLWITDEQEGLCAIVEADSQTHALVIGIVELHWREARFESGNEGFHHEMVGVKLV